ncbi:MAG: four-carbon acid sugar kinase family protein [Bacteroidia bacterium]|nr:four-carbon acid sugar kinase family protein [Bacteroidia bacterium]
MNILLSFYGDDFTGSTDVMEALHFNGVPSALFLNPPTAEEIRKFRLKTTGQNLQAFGVAGMSRAMSPQEMEKQLPPVFEAISQISAAFFHYKICSTFDSAPTVGNIGTATDIALRYFPSPFVPMVVGAPVLRRYCVFGNLFAGIDGITYRIDRHPTMSRHPVTPMNESDLRLHLSKQTSRRVEIADIFSLENETFVRNPGFREEGQFILFDTLNETHLTTTGRILFQEKKPQNQLLVGSSGTEYALMAWLRAVAKLPQPSTLPTVEPSEQIIVMAGSCSPGTARQIQYARQQGYEDIRIDTRKLLSEESRGEETRIISEAEKKLSGGKSVVIYSAEGPEDQEIENFNREAARRGIPPGEATARIGKAQGKILKELLLLTHLRRVVVAGGDTSGAVATALGIYALEAAIPVAPGSPLCLAHAHEAAFDGLLIALKGGQVGNEKYFESIRLGKKLN